ncbi:MAG: PQQ-binding-like beta-propeller repeat protein [Pirellulaceae bacterium]|nr:PQQ-binding-like beta-propeller repeat protein [Pirellulaceae bacterium]
MKLHITLFAVLPFLLAADWLQFRGTDSNPVAPSDKLPTTMSATENVAWKAPLVGDAVSGPIVVKGRVVVTASSGPVQQDRLHVLCFDVKTGKQLWHRQLWATGRPFCHPTSANAAPTPASDGERIFAFYSSNDLVCLDLDGNLLWYRGLGYDYPKAGNDVGMSSSPLVVGDTVVVQSESQGDPFAAGFDVATGETRWRIARPTKMNWVSPTAIRGQDGKQVVLLQAGDGLAAFDPRTGNKLWSYDISSGPIPSATVVGGRIYLPAKGLTVLDAPADATSPSLAWDSNKLSPGNASPVVADGKVYTLAKVGVLTCGSEKDGEVLWQVRLKGTFWATPVIASGHAYCVNQEGQAFVVKLGKAEGEKGELIHTAELGEGFLGTPAIADNALYLRSEKNLWKIASP